MKASGGSRHCGQDASHICNFPPTGQGANLMPFAFIIAIGMVSIKVKISLCSSASTLSKFYSTVPGRAEFIFAYIVEKL